MSETHSGDDTSTVDAVAQIAQIAQIAGSMKQIDQRALVVQGLQYVAAQSQVSARAVNLNKVMGFLTTETRRNEMDDATRFAVGWVALCMVARHKRSGRVNQAEHQLIAQMIVKCMV